MSRVCEVRSEEFVVDCGSVKNASSHLAEDDESGAVASGESG